MRRVAGEGDEAVAEVYRHVEDGDDRALEGSCLCYVVNASDGALLYSTHISLKETSTLHFYQTKYTVG